MTEELKKVLNMTEDEQWEWLWNYGKENPHYFSGIQFIRHIFPKEKLEFWAGSENLSLADLAFRLRDEVGQGKFVNGIIEVFEHLYGYSNYKSVMMWICSEECKSIYWVMAGLWQRGNNGQEKKN